MSPDDLRVSSIYATPLSWVLLGVLCFIALLHQEQTLVLLSAAVGGVMLLAWIWGRISGRRLDIDVTTDRRRLFAGEGLALDVAVRNDKFLPVWTRLTPPFSADFTSRGGAVQAPPPAVDVALFWHQAARFAWDLIATRRGVYRLGPQQALTGDLLGFFPHSRPAPAGVELIVFPRLVPLQPVPLPKRELFGTPGAASPVTDPVYLLGTRDYQPGRPARFVHWHASARHQKLQEKIFEPSAREKVLLALDVSGFAEQRADEAFEQVLEVLAAWTVALEARGAQVALTGNGTLKMPDGAMEPMTGHARTARAILESLARLTLAVPGIPLADRLARVPGDLRGTCCIHFAHSFNEEGLRVRALCRRYRQPLLSVIVEDHASSARPEDGEAGAVYLLNDLHAGLNS